MSCSYATSLETASPRQPILLQFGISASSKHPANPEFAVMLSLNSPLRLVQCSSRLGSVTTGPDMLLSSDMSHALVAFSKSKRNCLGMLLKSQQMCQAMR